MGDSPALLGSHSQFDRYGDLIVTSEREPPSTTLRRDHGTRYAVSQVVGFIKGKSAIHITRTYAGRKRSYVGQHFWVRGYFVSTVGRDEQVIREYIRGTRKLRVAE